MSDERQLPNAVEMEKMILSCCLQRPEDHIALAKGAGINRDSFYFPAHAMLWRVFHKLWKRGDKVDIEIVSLTQKLREAGMLENLGGPSYITEVYTAAPSAGNFLHYCSEVREKAALRTAYERCRSIAAAIMDGGTSVEALKSLAEASAEVQRTGTSSRRATPMTEALDAFEEDWVGRAKGDHSQRISTGIYQLDDATDGGFGKTWSVVIAGATKSGKTALAGQIALNAILEGQHVVFFSMEMAYIELLERMLANQVNIPLPVMCNPHGNLSEDETTRNDQVQRIQRGITKLREFPNVWFIDDVRMNIDDLCEEVTNLEQLHGIDLLVADYVQLIRGRQGQSREREVANVSARLKQVAMEHDLCSIVLAQLNDDGKARESRAIFQDANLVLETTKEEVIVVAQRQGDSGFSLPLKLEGRFMRFAATDESK